MRMIDPDTHACDAADAFMYALKNLIPKPDEPIGKVTVFKSVGEGLEISVKLSDKLIKFLEGEEKMNKNELLKDVDKIVITKDGDKKVLCRAYSGDRVVNTYDASCSPDDIFDFNIGAKLAMDRLYEGYDMTPTPKRKLYTGKIFIARYPGFGLRENTLYSVTNGIINDCLFGKDHPFIYCDMSDEALSAAICLNVYGCSSDVAKCSAYFVVR